MHGVIARIADRRACQSAVVAPWLTGLYLAGLWPPGPERIWPREPRGPKGMGQGHQTRRGTAQGATRPKGHSPGGHDAPRGTAQGATRPEGTQPRGPPDLNGRGRGAWALTGTANGATGPERAWSKEAQARRSWPCGPPGCI